MTMFPRVLSKRRVIVVLFITPLRRVFTIVRFAQSRILPEQANLVRG